MTVATLQDIIVKIRKLTGSASTLQLTDAAIIDYINSFYLYDLPAAYRSLKLQDRYTFNTQYGIDTYPFDSENYTSIGMPCYCAKREIKLFWDPWSFYGVNFNWQTQEFFATGDGTADAGGPGYSGTLQATPIIRSQLNNPITASPLNPTSSRLPTSPTLPVQPTFQEAVPGRVQNILISVNGAFGTSLNVTDDGAGNLIGDCTAGTINYETGAIAGLIFTAAVISGNQIQCQYNPTTLAIPLSILFYQNQFTLRPVPDRGYTIELMAYRQPSQALLGTRDSSNPNYSGVPEERDWWELLAAGAAKKIYEDRLDPDGITLMDKLLAERYAIAEARTYAQLGQNRIGTLFADQLQYSYGSGSFGLGNQGP